MNRYRFTESHLREVVLKSLSIAECCRLLGIKALGGNYKTLNKKFKEFSISTEHFTGCGWNQGLRFRKVKEPIMLEQVLVEYSTYPSYHLRKRLYKEGLKKPQCEVCGLVDWNGKPITVELDHINGIHTDHRLENLRILCPNCHSQTITFRGRNKTAPLS